MQHLSTKMKQSLQALCLSFIFASSTAHAEDWWWPFESATQPDAQIQVIEPYIEWRTGPAQGYPVVHVSEQGEWLTILKRKTEWLKVRDEKDRMGWVHVDDVLKTKDQTGRLVKLKAPRFDDFSSRRWEGGLSFGEFEETAVNAAYVGYWFTENISTELWGSQILGDASEIRMLNMNVVHQIFPDWRVSPFFTLGLGMLWVDPKSTLVDTSDRTEENLHAGLGLRYYMTDRYFIRVEVKDYKVFTDRETNEEATEWKIGLSVFF